MRLARSPIVLFGLALAFAACTYNSTGCDNCSSTGDPCDPGPNACTVADPPTGLTYTSTPAKAITDGVPIAGSSCSQHRVTTDTITVEESFLVADLTVAVDITHPYNYDLTLWLSNERGATALLRNAQIEMGTDIVETYTTTLPALRNMIGEPGQGEWTLHITDNYTANAGTLNSWTLTFEASDSVDNYYLIETPGGDNEISGPFVRVAGAPIGPTEYTFSFLEYGVGANCTAEGGLGDDVLVRTVPVEAMEFTSTVVNPDTSAPVGTFDGSTFVAGSAVEEGQIRVTICGAERFNRTFDFFVTPPDWVLAIE